MGLWLSSADLLGQTINYQGRIVGDDGNPVNASWDVEVKVFGDEESQEAIYSEVISSVPIKNGLYSFSFGANGVGRRRETEVMGFGDSVTQVFNYTPTLKALAGTISVSDGSYSWSDLSGPTDEVNFIGSVNIPENNVSAIYRNSPPDHTTTIEVSYTYLVNTLAEVITDHDSAFVQIKVGEYVFPRETFSFSPYSLRSSYSNNELKLSSYRPVVYRGDGTASLSGILSETHESPSAGASYRIVVPKDVISKFAIRIFGDLEGSGPWSPQPVTVSINLLREDMLSGEVQTVELANLSSIEAIDYDRTVSINNWITSDDSELFTLHLQVKVSKFGKKATGARGGRYSLGIIVTHN